MCNNPNQINPSISNSSNPLDISFENGENKYFIEASAGTGKTYFLIHIVLRLIVEKKIPIEKILLVTFNKNAIDELKTRLRYLLNKVHSIFQDPNHIQANINKLDDKTLQEQLNRWSTGNSEEIRSLIEDSINKIDDASIHTIHAFCQKMLLQFPLSSRESFSIEHSDCSSLKRKTIDEVVRIVAKGIKDAETKRAFLSNKHFKGYLESLSQKSRLRKFVFYPDDSRKFNENKLLFEVDDSNNTYVKFGIAPCEKTAPQFNRSEMEKALQRFFEAAPKLFHELKKQHHVIDYDDMLCQMEENLNEQFTNKVRDAYDAVLIDEFQDTDSIQSSIFETIFLKSNEKIVIYVGDPKQSIYNWRSADINSYFGVKKKKGITTKSLGKNFRSTPGLVEAANIFFSNESPSKQRKSFRNIQLDYAPIEFNGRKLPLFKKVAGENYEPITPFELWLECPDKSVKSKKSLEASAVAEDIAKMLKGNVFLGNPKRPLRKSDIAVLTRSRDVSDQLRNELSRLNIGWQLDKEKDNVLSTQEAKEIFAILRALENPKDRKRVNGARSTRIFGEKLSAIVNDEEARDRAYRAIEQANKILASNGVLASFTWLFNEFLVEDRLLKQHSGGRVLTNYKHILELLYKQNRKIKTVSGLLRWMQNNIASEEEDNNLRRESDDDLVQIMTIHASKGLEYPVVYILRTTYLGKCPDDELEEQIRIAYVAFTRASSRLVVPLFYERKKDKNVYVVGKNSLCAPFLHALAPDFDGSGLNDTLFELDRKPHLHTRLKTLTTDKQKPKNLRKVLEEAVNEDDCPFKGKVSNLDKFEAGAIYKFRLIEDSNEIQKLTFEDETVVSSFTVNQDTEQKPLESSNQKSLVDPKQIPSEDDLKPARFDQNNPSWRKPDWTQTSFTGLTKGLHWSKYDPAMDEPTDDDDADNVFDEGLLKNKPKNVSATSFGSFLHKLLEDLKDEDFQHISKVDLASFLKLKSTESQLDKDSKAVLGYVRTKLQDFSSEPPPAALALDLTEMLIHVLQVKGFKDLGDFQLCQLKDNERISEMDFLIKTRNPSKSTNLSAKELGELLENLDKQKYAGLNLSDKKELNGYLNGSIDLVFYHNEKFWIIDWKSNKLKNYHQDTLEKEMKKNHYKLQYLLYTVALKRFLESRGIKDAYQKIGGVAYFFLRGIKKDNPESGIYFERPADNVIKRLDEVLL